MPFELGKHIGTKGNDLQVVITGVFDHVVEKLFGVSFPFHFGEYLSMVDSQMAAFDTDGHFAKACTVFGYVEGAVTFIVELESDIWHGAKVGISGGVEFGVFSVGEVRDKVDMPSYIAGISCLFPAYTFDIETIYKCYTTAIERVWNRYGTVIEVSKYRHRKVVS